MKVGLLLLLYFLTPNSKVYTFDYRLEYEVTNDVGTAPRTSVYFINKDMNSFSAVITSCIEHGAHLTFNDQFTTIFSGNVSGDFKNPGDVVVKTTQISEFATRAKNNHKYIITRVQDTIVDDKTFAQMKILPKNIKKAKRNKIGTTIILIDTTKILKPLYTCFFIKNVYESADVVPNGMLQESHYYDENGKWKSSTKLKDFSKTDFKFTIE